MTMLSSQYHLLPQAYPSDQRPTQYSESAAAQHHSTHNLIVEHPALSCRIVMPVDVIIPKPHHKHPDANRRWRGVAEVAHPPNNSHCPLPCCVPAVAQCQETLQVSPNRSHGPSLSQKASSISLRIIPQNRCITPNTTTALSLHGSGM